MRTHFASCLLTAASAVERNFASPWYYGSYGHHGSGFVDQHYMPTQFIPGPSGAYNPATGGYVVVPFPEADHDSDAGKDKNGNIDSPSDSYDSFSDYFYSADDSYNHSGHSLDSNQSQFYVSNADMFDNPNNDNISISRDSESDFDRQSAAGYSAHGRKHCFDVNNFLSDRSNGTLSDEERIVCFYSDSDDDTFHSQAKDDDVLGTRSSDSDSDDTNTTDDGSAGTTYDGSYDSIGSDVYGIRPDYAYYYHHPRTHHVSHGVQLAYPFSVLNQH